MLSTIVFDMGNVLVHFSHERMCRQIGALCERTHPEVQQLLLDSGLQWNFERGLMLPEQLHSHWQTLVGRACHLAEMQTAASDIFELNEPMVPLLEELKRLKFQLVLLSNTSIWHFEYIRQQFTVLDYFDDFVLSYEVGAIKPEPAIYEELLRRIKGPPQTAFYTDDIPLYVETGRSYGLQAEVFTTVPLLRDHLREHGVPLAH